MKRILFVVLVRVVLAAVFAILDMALHWEYFRWGYFKARYFTTPLHPVLLVFIVLLMASALWYPIRELYGARKIPFLQTSAESALRWIREMFSRLHVQFLFWGVIILLVTGLAWDMGFLRDETFRYNQMPIPWRTINTASSGAVGVLRLYIRDDNPEAHLRLCLRIARDAEAAGAKAVLVKHPIGLRTKVAEDLLAELKKSNIVVVDRGWRDYTLGSARSLSFIYRVDPFPFRKFRLSKDIPDDVFKAIRLYYGMPEEPIVRKKAEIMIGSLRFPTDADGIVYVGRIAWPDYSLRFTAFGGASGASVAYVSGFLEEQQRYSSLAEIKEQIEGKIIILQDSDPNGDSFWETQRTAQILDDLIKREVLTRSASGSAMIAVISILGCGFIFYRTKPLTATALLVLFSTALLFLQPWLFQEKKILVDMPWSLAALLVSAAVFTVVRLGYEWRMGVSRSARVSGRGTASSAPGLSLSRTRISLSPRLAIGIVALVVLLTVVVANGVREKPPGEQSTNPAAVYVMPTIEVQGVPVSTNTQ